ncbi:MAG TPA: ATP-binding cassette domain-containing protein [Casimicrobiaceae bacterium]|nr:ATP-binding cassette domain-containing protein [Casimicrobiaceae bacterium]
MIRLTGLTLARGAKRLLENTSLTIHAGHRVGLVGPNGSGKSSVFALLRGEIHQEAGDVELPAKWTIAHVAQETPAVVTSALDFVQDGDAELRTIERALATAGAERSIDGHALAELHHRYEIIDGYSAHARAASLLAGLGVGQARQTDPVASFSGGWRMRLNLAQALMARSDLLLLDEPTNHLDLDAALWLEDWLAAYPGTLLLITHDRDFLDAIAQSIVHIDNRQLRRHSGNYSAFERERTAQLATQQASYEKQQRQIAHLQAFVDRFRAKPNKAKQAQSRLKTLEKMERIAAAHVDSPFTFSFAPAGLHARQVVRLEGATLRYGDAPPVFERLDASLLAGERIGLLGANGAGKSTLVKALAHTLPLSAGERFTTPNLRIGYFAQHQLEQLDAASSPLRHLQRLEPSAREQDLRDFLGGFDFRGNQVSAAVADFSGGEKARVVLAMIVRAKPQLVILDEPTNHLDIEMREALAEALQDFDGTLVVVAHDRHLLSATTDIFWLVNDGRVEPFDGDLDDYRRWVLSRDTRDAPRSTAAFDRRSERRKAAEQRQQRYAQRKPLVDRLGTVEDEMAALAQRKTAADAWLASADAYDEVNRERLKATVAEQGDITWRLARLEAQWLELAEALESLDAEDA